MPSVIRIGTRRSKLALIQARYIAQLLEKHRCKTQIIEIDTIGDKILDRSVSKIGDKGVFTAELEDGLTAGEIDIAVHSAKDLPSSLNEGLKIIAYSESEPAEDVLISNKPIQLDTESSFTLGTSSVRRKALLRHYFPKIKTVDIRGNLQTRFKKLNEGLCDGLVLAFAGVNRLGLESHIIHRFPIDQLTPAVGQGALALEASENLDAVVYQLIRNAVNHSATEVRLSTERAFLQTVEGGCSIPVFAYARIFNDIIEAEGGIISLDGQQLIRKKITGEISSPETVGKALGETLLQEGGKEILDQIRNENNPN